MTYNYVDQHLRKPLGRVHQIGMSRNPQQYSRDATTQNTETAVYVVNSKNELHYRTEWNKINRCSVWMMWLFVICGIGFFVVGVSDLEKPVNWGLFLYGLGLFLWGAYELCRGRERRFRKWMDEARRQELEQASSFQPPELARYKPQGSIV